jgi:23S rRNA pseudouridine2605 synthase
VSAGKHRTDRRPREERLQKVLSRAGIASRRQAEQLIREGRVRVNGETVAELGKRVSASDEIRVDGNLVDPEPELLYVLLHKPAGTLSSRSDPRGRQTVLDLLPEGLRGVFPVGRLDWNTEGLLLLTNDGALAHRMTHPRYGVERVYAVKVKGLLNPKDPRIKRLLSGVPIGRGVVARAKRVDYSGRSGKHSWFRIVLREGKNREVRRIFRALGLDVLKLKRAAYGPLTLGGLARGQWCELTHHEVKVLRSLVRANE